MTTSTLHPVRSQSVAIDKGPDKRAAIKRKMRRVLEDISSRFKRRQKIVTLAVLADIALRKVAKRQGGLPNLTKICNKATEKEKVLALKYLGKVGLIRRAPSFLTRDKLTHFQLANGELADALLNLLEKHSDVRAYLYAENLTHPAGKPDSWQKNTSIYLTRNQLEKSILVFLDILPLQEISIRFLLESALYRKSQALKYIAKYYGLDKTYRTIEQFIHSDDMRLRLGAAYGLSRLDAFKFRQREIGDLLYRCAMSDAYPKVRILCAYGLAKYYRNIHIEKIKQDTQKVRFGLLPFSTRTFDLFYRWLAYRPKNILNSSTREERALDIIAVFQACNIDLSCVRRVVRRKARLRWHKRRLMGARLSLLDWSNQGRLIGLSAALGWLATTGAFLSLLVKNIFIANTDVSGPLYLMCVGLVSFLIVVVGLSWGKSISKTTFVRHALLSCSSWYKYVLHNTPYKTILLVLVLASVLLARDVEHYAVAYSITGLLLLWLIVPLIFHASNKMDWSHREIIRGKTFLGGLVIFYCAFYLGHYLSNHHQDDQYFFFFVVLAGVISAIYSIIYFASNMSIEAHSLQGESSRSLTLTGLPLMTNLLLIGLSIIVFALAIVDAYGKEALLGRIGAKKLEYSSKENIYYAKDANQYGVGDLNYYKFDVNNREPVLMRIPLENNLQRQQNAVLNFDKLEELDVSFSPGEAYLVPPGEHFVTARSKDHFSSFQKRHLFFAYHLDSIPETTAGFVKKAKNKPGSLLMLDGLKATRVMWYRNERNGYWTATLTDMIDSSSSTGRFRILKPLFSTAITNVNKALIYAAEPEQGALHASVTVQPLSGITHVSTDTFFQEIIDNAVLENRDGYWELTLYLHCPDLDPSMSHFETILFYDLAVKSQ
ncbi:hypothetical protein [Teredinibacter sp. KSP-S5-2]|uniref:hypothetical protein n=1 Tax=Teredinibacter sp. KSP-S5-2 TaxID=3034506 RepID=UPI002934F10D|nr:hypothetical protein [Teredinibacter sp. KSP-S5-2]WNO08929.1 hypothetical protein P5V12_18440 [Teredinibacter sp. KSP-S5-2]